MPIGAHDGTSCGAKGGDIGSMHGVKGRGRRGAIGKNGAGGGRGLEGGGGSIDDEAADTSCGLGARGTTHAKARTAFASMRTGVPAES